MAVEAPQLIVADVAQWRAWLADNVADAAGVWLVLAKKGVTEPTRLSYDEALEEALCQGWIDGQVRRRDERTYLQRFTPRRARSRWSQRNVGIVERLTADGRMRPQGLAEVERAKADGRWEAAYAGPATAQVPDDLARALAASPAAGAMFAQLTGQNRYSVLHQVGEAKRPETRARRIDRFVAMLERGETVYPQRRPAGAEALAVEAVERVLRAAAALRGGARVEVDPAHVAAAVRSERLLRVDGEPQAGFAPLSRFWPAADGWVRTHANYAWHRDALLAALETDADGVAAAIEALPAAEVEARAYAAGGLAVAVRSAQEWRASAGDGGPLVAAETIPGAPPRPAGRLRVLDLTRVIAGPVGTRMLGVLGADVLRLDPPHLPELEPSRWDGLLAKRSAILDLADPRREALLAGADVVVCGYRPGSLDRFGLSPEALAERHPGIVVVTLSAWGDTPGWSGRRGFDSLVQAATGIALRCGDPGALPCQLLDHVTGHLVAAAALEGVAAQRREGGTPVARLALSATAAEVLRRPLVAGDEPDAEPFMVNLGPRVRAVAPPGSLGGEPLRWPGPPAAYGADEPAWPPPP